MACAAFVYHHRGRGEVGGEVADRSRVVEVDVGDDDPSEVGRAEPERRERGVHGRNARLRAGLHQRRHRAADEESGGELIHAAEECVELLDPGCDLDRVAHCCSGLRLWTRGRAGPRLLSEQLLQLLQVGLHLGLVHTIERVIARHERHLGSRVVGDDLGVERDDLLLQRPDRCGRRRGARAG